MRIRTDGKFSSRQSVIDDAAQLWGCNKSKALLRSAKFALAMLGHPGLASRPGALHDALDHPQMTPELASVLSTKYARLSYRVESELEVNPEKE
jgi:hypothetical protein